MLELEMSLRAADVEARTVTGIVVPYDETTYLVPVAGGERVRRGAFTRSIRNRGDKVPLFRNHDRALRMGTSVGFEETDDGLLGTFRINEGDAGDALLAETRQGYYGGLSAGFMAVRRERGTDGAQEVVEGRLEETSLVGHPAYTGSGLLSVRNAEDRTALLAPFLARPDVNLAPVPPLRYGPR
jgi:HK97 family phage prohead protease